MAGEKDQGRLVQQPKYNQPAILGVVVLVAVVLVVTSNACPATPAPHVLILTSHVHGRLQTSASYSLGIHWLQGNTIFVSGYNLTEDILPKAFEKFGECQGLLHCLPPLGCQCQFQSLGSGLTVVQLSNDTWQQHVDIMTNHSRRTHHTTTLQLLYDIISQSPASVIGAVAIVLKISFTTPGQP